MFILNKDDRKKYVKDIVKSDSYKNQLDEMAERIRIASLRAPNEATIESNFDCELFAFFRENFSHLGFDYNPIKEKNIGIRRNVLRGRADTSIGCLIIEFKQPTTLNNKKKKTKAIEQIKAYLDSEQNSSQTIFKGFITDGIIGAFVLYRDGVFHAENFYEITGNVLNEIILSILQVKVKRLNAKNLVDGLCNFPENNGVSYKIAEKLFEILNSSIHPKTEMLYNEWRELFNLAHDDISKQQAIESRKKALEECFDVIFENKDDEYKALFALQTSYAIIIKVIAFKVLSLKRYNTSLINFYDVLEMEKDTLRSQMEELEEGAIFIQYGITNLLEGDFFSWYVNDEQWNDELYIEIRKLFEILSRFEDEPVVNVVQKSQDFFKELYQTMIPVAVRHSLGEYYTKKWLAEIVVEEGLKNIPKNWRGLDPCCGSGTFVTVLIDKVLNLYKSESNSEQLREVLSRVTGIDLNPIAVLTARVNYFINISNLITDDTSFEIPIYLGDSSYVPEKIKVDNVDCLRYSIKTLQEPIEILIPRSMVRDVIAFSRKMTKIELYIKSLDDISVYETFLMLCEESDKTEIIKANLKRLSLQLVQLEERKWNGVWARIITNFLTTANLGKFDLIVGNPPWVDWKSLPSGYRDRIKDLCISRELFSGDAFTGGINLNICALITNVVAENWLSEKGVLGFLMPEPLIFQQSYEGFRNLLLSNKRRLWFFKFMNWNFAGKPFDPVTQKFLTYFISSKKTNYNEGIEVEFYKKKKKGKQELEEVIDVAEVFEKEQGLLSLCHSEKNFFGYVDSKKQARDFRNISGESYYIGREGIEFYPQELIVFNLSENVKSSPNNMTVLENIQNKKSKYKVPKRTVVLETSMLHPMIKGVNVIPFHVDIGEYIVPFPYESSTPQIPINSRKLGKLAPNLLKYYQSNKKLLEAQTGYSDKIIGKKNAEFYSLARVGKYSYAPHYVVFRDNTKWAAAVISEVDTKWGGKKRPVFQNHAVSICEHEDGSYISLEEAHYICGILNSSVVYDYMMKSSDSRSFPIRPRVKIPKFDNTNKMHIKIVELSKKAHANYDNEEEIKQIKLILSDIYLQII